MIRLRKLLSFAAVALVGAATLAAPSQAQAAYSVRVYDDGVLQGGISVFVVGNSLVFVGSTTHFNISGSGLSNNPGTPTSANLSLSNNAQVTTTFGATGGTHILRIELSQDGWTNPSTDPLILSSSSGGSFAYVQGSTLGATEAVNATYQGFLDNTNTLFGQPGSGSTPLQTAGASLTVTGTAPLVFAPPVATSLVPNGVPYSLTDVLTLSFTLDPGSGQATANVSASTTASPVPAPAGLILALTALPCLGVGAWLRRRTASPTPTAA